MALVSTVQRTHSDENELKTFKVMLRDSDTSMSFFKIM